jgi:Ca2+-binding RTX toxin-like protein
VADGALLDYESATEHAIEVEVTDPGALTATQVFTIAVTNVNEAPSIEGLDASEVAEGSVEGTVVGGVGASDPDAGEMLSYALIDDADGRFVIDPDTGVISVAAGATLDYENAMQHGIEVEVTDAGGLSASQVFAIDVTNVNEQPAIQELSANGVIEGATDGTVIGTVAAFDADGDSGLAFELTDDAQGRFAIDPATGVITVADGTLLDYDDASQHSVEVTVTDPGGLSDVATYVIELHKDNSGNDALTGDDGDNVLDGGPGDDIFHGGNGNDHLIGGPGDDFMFGENDDDLLDGDDGNDQMFGGRGADRLNGGDGADEMFGNAGDDILIGGDGADLLYGDADNDVLVGGAGDDVLRGGDGADRFVFESPDDGLDVILDFASDDVLAIGDMLVGFADGAEAAFVRLVDDGSATTVEVDVDGAANGESYQPIVVLDAITGTSLEDLVSAGQIDFWLS